MKRISVIGLPMDLGQSRRGVDMGPSALRYAGAIEWLAALSYNVKDLGDLPVVRSSQDKVHKRTHLKHLEEVTTANRQLARLVDEEVSQGVFPLIFGGDHSISIGSLAGIAKHYDNLGVIWYDAHGDLNTEDTTPSGNIHGMSLAVNLGFGHSNLTELHGYSSKIKPENTVLIGVRSLDSGEKTFIKDQGIRVYTMHEIDRRGMAEVMEEALSYLKQRTDGLHLSVDLDGLDPTEAPGVGTPVTGGMTYRESHLAMEMIAESDLLTSAEFVEVNPILDDKNKTATLAVGLMGSLFGETLL